MSRILTDKDKEEIIDKYKQGISIHSLKKEYGTTWLTVSKVIKNAGLELPESNEWKQEEIKQLEELSKTYHYKDIASIMNKSDNAIYLKARRLNIILIQDRRKWLPTEEEYFQLAWGNKPVDEIAKELRRTVFSLKVKAIRMGLGSMISNSDKLSISEVSELLNVTRDRIMDNWSKNGLNIESIILGQKRSYYQISYDDLIVFLKNNPYEWDSRNIEEGMLGPEEEWLTDKRKWDEENNPLFYRRWTDEEIMIAIKMISDNKSYEDIATCINRSKQAVSYMLRGLGYKLHEWSEYDTEFLIDNYKELTYQEIADILNKSLDSVEYNIVKNNLSKRRKKQEK
jgi:DNA-binding CsgD family transcriptional regulator